MKKAEIIKSQQVDHIANEHKILSTISHPFIVPSVPLRLTSTASLKIPGVSTFLWSLYREVSSSLICEKKECSSLTKQRIFYLM